MKTMISNLCQNAIKIIPALALLLAVSSVSATCFFMSHQPDVPEGLKKFEK